MFERDALDEIVPGADGKSMLENPQTLFRPSIRDFPPSRVLHPLSLGISFGARRLTGSYISDERLSPRFEVIPCFQNVTHFE